MIVDIFNEVISNLKASITDATVLTEFPKTAPSFPCITFREITNDTHIESIDTSGEHYNQITFEVNIFTKGQTRESKARLLRNSVDTILSDFYGMTRGFSDSIPNYSDLDVYRYILRYTFIIREDKTIFRR